MTLWSLSKLRCYNLYRTLNPASVACGNSTASRFFFDFYYKRHFQIGTKHKQQLESKAVLEDDIQATTSTALVGDSNSRNTRNGTTEVSWEPPLPQKLPSEEGHAFGPPGRFAEGTSLLNHYGSRWKHSDRRQRVLYRKWYALGPLVRNVKGTYFGRKHWALRKRLGRRLLIRKRRVIKALNSPSVDFVQSNPLCQTYAGPHLNASSQTVTTPAGTGSQRTSNYLALDGLASSELLRPRSAGLIRRIGKSNVKGRRTTLHSIEIWVRKLRFIYIKKTSDQSGNSEKFIKRPRYFQKLKAWSNHMLWMLKREPQHQPNPERALALLRNTLAQPLWRPRYYLIEDVALYLIHFFLDHATQTKPDTIEKLYRTYCTLLHTWPPRRVRRVIGTVPHWRAFCLLINHSTEEQLNLMLQALKKKSGLSMPAYQMVRIINRLLRTKRNEAALNIFHVFKWTNVDIDDTDQVRSTCIRLLLKSSTQESQSNLILQTMKSLNISMSIDHILDTVHQLVDQGRIQESLDLLDEFGQRYPEHVSSDPFQVACVLLLRLRPEVWNWYQIHQNILGQILKTGIKPNIHFINVLLFAAFEAEDYQTAWQMYNIAKENGLQPTKHTYSIIVNGAKHEGNGKELEAAIQGAREDGFFFTSERVACDIMHATFLYEFSRSRRPFDLLLPMYNMVFTCPLLIELGMLPADYEPSEVPEDSHISRPPVPLLEPSPRAITHMIYAYLIQSRGKPSKALKLYQAYTSMVAANHPTIAPLIETPNVSSAFVKAIGHHSETLSFCTTILEHMMYPPADWPTVEHPPALPNVVTWSTLLAAFLFKGQKTAAHRVLEMMRDRSIKPDRVTWTSMISGYATLPDVQAAVGAVVKMEEEGWGIDEYTLKALSRVVDKQKLMRELKKATGRDTRDLAEEAGVDVGVEQN